MLRSLPKKHRRSLAIALLACLLVMFLWPAAVVKAPSQKELRGTWMTHFGLSLSFHTSRLDNMMANLAKHQVNTLYPAVWNHGHSLYRSAVVSGAGGSDRNPWVNLPFSADLLTEVTQQAHRQHIRLIPWFEYGLMIPLDADIVKQHPDWLTVNLKQQQTDHPGDQSHSPWRSLSNAIKGENQGWLNPLHPEVQAFLINLITEVVQHYPVDGIQLDDHFGLPVDYGYDAYTIALYRQEHQGKTPPKNPSEAEWMRWRSEKLTQLMGEISRSVKQSNPKAIVSLSPNAPEFAYRKYLQDWPTWVQASWLDQVVVQLYRPDLTSLKQELNRPTLRSLAQQVPLSVGLYTGPVGQAKSKAQIDQEVAAVRSAGGYGGVAFFCWETTFWWLRGR
jgi:uncharacterized lipoprotein YddW (UPF0748 family)